MGRFRCIKRAVLLWLVLLMLFPVSSISETSPQTEQRQTKGRMVTFNFVDVELPVITKFISEITGKNFIFDERVKGKLTIIAPSKISIDEAYDLFLSVLELKGFTVVPSGVDAYKILPLGEARQKGLPIVKEPVKVNEAYIVRLVPLQYISADEAVKFLQPMVSRDGYISAFGPGNFIIIVDSGTNIEKLLSMLEFIDKPSKELEPEIIFLNMHHQIRFQRLIMRDSPG